MSHPITVTDIENALRSTHARTDEARALCIESETGAQTRMKHKLAAAIIMSAHGHGGAPNYPKLAVAIYQREFPEGRRPSSEISLDVIARAHQYAMEYLIDEKRGQVGAHLKEAIIRAGIAGGYDPYLVGARPAQSAR